jgi:Uma2 family endonuclease
MTARIISSPNVEQLGVCINPVQAATWEDYLQHVENLNSQQERVFFDRGRIWIEDMGNEGINHARFNKLFTLIFGFWFAKQPDIKFDLLGGCVLEKPQSQGCAPDEVVYIGENSPQYQLGGSRRVNLNEWRVPDLVVEIADTTLASDLDEKKQLYLTLEIPEYWVVDVRGKQVFAFRLIDGKYQQCMESIALAGLSIDLLEQTIAKMDNVNGNAAVWFAAQLENIPESQS